MKNSIGIEKTTLVRDARKARRPAAAAARFACPPFAAATAEAITIFWLRQITPQTFASITVPNSAPGKIAAAQGFITGTSGGRAPARLAMMRAPVSKVIDADQLNHHQ